ncbi:36849_t:CDS:2, partial [Racocetra persica]
TPRLLHGTGNDNFDTSEVGQTEQSPLQKYWTRAVKFENLFLFQLYQRYRFYKGVWRKYDYEKLFNRHLAEREDELDDLLKPSVDNIEEEVENDEGEQLETDEDDNEI